MKEFFPSNSVEYFVSYYDYYQPEAYVPVSDTYIAKDASLNEHIEQMRLSATKSLTERKDAVVVASVSAIYGLGDPKTYFKMILHLVAGDILDRNKIKSRLTELQYERNDTELRRGTFSVKGEIIDIFPADSEKDALRVELFDNEIENWWRFSQEAVDENRRKMEIYFDFIKKKFNCDLSVITMLENDIQNIDNHFLTLCIAKHVILDGSHFGELILKARNLIFKNDQSQT